MKKFTKNFIIFLLTCFINVVAFADDSINSDYDADYYENEGNLVFKFRASGIIAKGKQSGFSLPNSPNKTTVPVGNFVSNGYGFDASTSIFFSSHVAAEISVGFNSLRLKKSSLNNVSNSYGGNVVSPKKELYLIPVTVTGQYHIAPFGGIRPYVGAGYYGEYTFTRSKNFTVKNGWGPVLQAGVDFYAKDSTLINFDIRQYFLKTSVNYRNVQQTYKDNVQSKVRLNPLLISIGIGFRF